MRKRHKEQTTDPRSGQRTSSFLRYDTYPYLPSSESGMREYGSGIRIRTALYLSQKALLKHNIILKIIMMHPRIESNCGKGNIHQTMHIRMISLMILRTQLISPRKISQRAYMSGIADTED